MADCICLHSKDDVERFGRQNPFLHVYALGDLDNFFWPFTTWYALRDEGQVRQLVLLYFGQPLPVVLAYAESPTSLMRVLIQDLVRLLPRRFYAHLSAGVVDILAETYDVQAHGLFYKMGLLERQKLGTVDSTAAVALTESDTADLLALYTAGYPTHWFVPRMLQTGYYYGVRRERVLASVAGVHVYAPTYQVAALGNIATRPEARGQGLATLVTARLCLELLRSGIEHIGLNVRADNVSAVACYRKLGFERVADYGEYTLTMK